MNKDTFVEIVDREAAAEFVDGLDVLGEYYASKSMGGEKLSGCGALLEFTMEAARLLPEHWLTYRLILFINAMHALMEIPGNDGALHKLRIGGTPRQEARCKLFEAEQSLRKAAHLLGLPEEFYIRTSRVEKRREYFLKSLNSRLKADGIEIQENTDLFQSVDFLNTFPAHLFDTYPVEHPLMAAALVQMAEELGYWTEAPSVEGETPDERRIRQRLAKVHFGKIANAPSKLVDFFVSQHDSRQGAGGNNASTTQLSIRIIWGYWPKDMQAARGREWQPKRVAAEIIKYCGHSADSRAVGRYASNQQAKEREKEDLD